MFAVFYLGLGEKIWTSGLLNPIQARYQTAPHPVGRTRRIISGFGEECKYFFQFLWKTFFFPEDSLWFYIINMLKSPFFLPLPIGLPGSDSRLWERSVDSVT